MGLPKLWGKDKEGNRGFAFSHVKTIYYNWASKILLKTKLDEMDALIDAKIAKAMMSNQQVNDANKVPTSALAYLMSQNITKNANDISDINGNLINRLAVSETVFSTIDDFPKTGSGFGVVRNPLTLYEGFTIPEYSRCIFINYTNSNDGALIAIISDKTYTAFRNNGKWQSGRILVTNTDLNPEVYIVPKPSDTSTFTFSNRSFQVSVRKSGKVVTIQLNISGSMAAVSDFVTAFTIPQKYKPLTDIVINYVTQNTAKAITLFITQNGEVKFTNFNTSIDDWLCRQCITYVTDN